MLIRCAMAVLCAAVAATVLSAQSITGTEAQKQELLARYGTLLVELATSTLEAPALAAPQACFDAWLAGNDKVVVRVGPSAEKAGLQQGDILTRIGAQAFAKGKDESWSDAMRALPAGLTTYTVEVERDGKTVSLRMPCEPGLAKAYFDGERAMWTAMARRDWNGCYEGGRRMLAAFGVSVSVVVRPMTMCLRAGDSSLLPNVQFVLGQTLAIERATWEAEPDLDEELADVLEDLDAVEARGGDRFATQLRELMTTLNLKPPSAAALANARGSEPPARSGTGFVVSPTGTIVTALHVVQKAALIRVKCGKDEALDATVTSQSAALDIAVLQVTPARPMEYLDVARDVSGVGLGNTAFTVGFPATDLLGLDAKFTEGTISGLSGIGGDASFFQVSVPIQPGNSGGPLVDARGRVIGVVLSTASAPAFISATGTLPQNVNWAVKGSLLAPMLSLPALRAAAATRQDAINRTVAAACVIAAVS